MNKHLVNVGDIAVFLYQTGLDYETCGGIVIGIHDDYIAVEDGQKFVHFVDRDKIVWGMNMEVVELDNDGGD